MVAPKLVALLSEQRAALDKLPLGIGCTNQFLHEMKLLSGAAKAHLDFDVSILLPSERPDFATKRLINNLAHLYRAETGKPATRSVHQDHYDRTSKHGMPGGSFFRLVSAMFDLLEESRTPYAIDAAIKERRNMGKTRMTRS